MSRPRSRDYAETARVARHALTQGRRPAAEVAAHYNISEPAANSAIRQARRNGHHIPAAYGYTIAGRYVPFSADGLDAGDFVAPPARPGRPHVCDDCGHTAPTGWELAAHTLDTHDRTLTATERAPRTEEVAA